jgi:hypothetical protein
MNQKYGQQEIKDKRSAAAGKVKSKPGFVIPQNKIKNHTGDRRQYRKGCKDTYNYLFLHTLILLLS